MIFLLDFRSFNNTLQYLLMKLISKLYGYGCVLNKIPHFEEIQLFSPIDGVSIPHFICLLRTRLADLPDLRQPLPAIWLTFASIKYEYLGSDNLTLLINKLYYSVVRRDMCGVDCALFQKSGQMKQLPKYLIIFL